MNLFLPWKITIDEVQSKNIIHEWSLAKYKLQNTDDHSAVRTAQGRDACQRLEVSWSTVISARAKTLFT
jgi:hypothetical protein